MKLRILALGALTLVALAGCQQATNTNAAATVASFYPTSSAGSTTTYWNLSTNTQVTGDDIKSNKWDIAVSSSTQGVWTNSGATASALGSGGQGGVYYSGSTVYTDVKSYNSAGFTGTWNTDRQVYVTSTGQSGTTTSTSVLNVMTALDYSSGTGSEDEPYSYTDLTTAYAGNAYYTYVQGSGVTVSTNPEVYVIRSGNGEKYFKLQITSMKLENNTRTRTIKCEQLTTSSTSSS